jgi:magnesium chelatase family protein
MDEFSEFRRDAVEGLRQPLEDGRVVVIRAQGSVEFPARFSLVAASNPCPCGYAGDSRRMCRCPANRLAAYQQRLSGPVIDRIDLRLTVPRLTRLELMESQPGEGSDAVRHRVEDARERQRRRLRGTPWVSNSHLSGPAARIDARLTPSGEAMLSAAVDRLALSGRGFDRTLRVARTIADLAGHDSVEDVDVAEALAYRAPIRSEAEIEAVG